MSRENEISERGSVQFDDPIVKSLVDDDPIVSESSILGFSMTSPDLVICSGSPDIAGISYCDSPVMLKSKHCCNLDSSMELSFENGIDESEVEVVSKVRKTPMVKFSNVCQTFEPEEEFLSREASFELRQPPVTKVESLQDYSPGEFNSRYLLL